MQRRITRTAMSGRFMMLSPSQTSTAVIPDGQMYCQAWDLAAPVTIDQTLVECVTTPGGAGSLVRGGWYLDNGTFDKPGTLIVDMGTVDTSTTGVKTFSSTLTLPVGRVWCAMAPQGVPAPNPTLRTVLNNYAPHTTPTMTTATSQFMFQAAVTAALPATAAPATANSITIAMAVRFV